MTKPDKQFIEKLESHIEKANLNLKYSLDRFDILIISISSGGLVFSMGFVKDLLSDKINVDFLLLKISWILFATAIIFNLFSQVTGYYANKYEIRVTKNLIRQEKEKQFKGDQNKFIKLQNNMSNFTMILNGLSITFLILAILLLVIFMIINL